MSLGSLFWTTPAHATTPTLEEAQNALVIAQQEVVDATLALDGATENAATATVARDTAQTAYNEALAAYQATQVTVPGTSSTTTQNVVQNGTFDSTANWSNVVASSTVYTGGANPIIYNGTLKGSYSSGYYIQQTGTFPSPTRQVTFSADVWNYDTNEGNRINSPDYYRIEFRTYDANNNRLNYYNLEWSQWHELLTRTATYNLSTDAVRWDIGFRMADAGYWAGAFGPVIDNVSLVATMTQATPDTYTYGADETAAKDAAYQTLQSAQAALDSAVITRSSAQARLTAANSEVQRLTQLVYDLTPRLAAPGNLTISTTESGVDLSWTAPVPNLSGVTPERYAVSWSTTNFAQNGWGIASTTTSISIPFSTLYSTAPQGSTFQFAIRSDNDTLALYSDQSNIVSLTAVAPPWWQIEFSEGQTVSISTPEGYKFGSPTAWYGSPTDPNCGTDVSSIVNELINGRNTASFVADNGIFGDPCGGVVKVLRMSTPVDQVIAPTPTPTPTPSPEPQPSPTPEPVTPIVPPVVDPPVIEPQPQPQPIPFPVEPTPTPQPTPAPEPVVTPDPTPTPEETIDPTPEPTVEPTVPPTEEPTPEPTPSEEPVKEPEEVKPEQVPEPEQTAATEVLGELENIAPEELTDAQVEQLVDAAEAVLETAEQGSPAYEQALDALAVAAESDDAELPAELAAIPLLGDVAGAALELFNDLGNLGADMAPETRERAEETVIAAVIVGQVAQVATSAAVASAGAAASSAGSSGRRIK